MHTACPARPVLRLHGVSVRRGGRAVLRDVDWEVETGQRWVVLGPNGCGKTTLVNLAAGYLHPSSGWAEVLGHRLGRVDVRGLRARLGLTSAELAKALRADVAALDVVLSGLHGALETWWHEYTDRDRTRARELLAAGGAAELAGQPFRSLSEGERQQVLLARALVGRPELLLLDEPNAGLDLGAREALVRRLGDLAAAPGSPPMVMVTHHTEEIPAGFTHVLLMRDGRVLASGELGPTLTDAAVSDCFGLPLHLSRLGSRFVCHAI